MTTPELGVTRKKEKRGGFAPTDQVSARGAPTDQVGAKEEAKGSPRRRALGDQLEAILLINDSFEWESLRETEGLTFRAQGCPR